MTTELERFVMTCPKCRGKKGFEDTTYDRTGEWCDCSECLGRGVVVNSRAFFKALATLPAAPSGPAPETSSPFVAEGQAICDGVPPASIEAGAGLVKWADLKPGDWYESRPKLVWGSPLQKVLNWDHIDTMMELRRCEPPRWWKDHQAEKLHASLEKEYGLNAPATEGACIHTMRSHPEGGDYCVKCGRREAV